MNNVIRKNWRDSATLITLARQERVSLSRTCIGDSGGVNYDIVLQTRTQSASFPNSVVFPGGVSELADASDHWLRVFETFGFNQHDYSGLHLVGTPVTPIFQNNPIRRHIALRITAIRETFEELGLLICSREHKNDKKGIWANIISDIEIKHWQKQVSKNPEEFLNLCKEHKCYPDIWSLHYWSNWLTPTSFEKRFDTAFFVTALETKPLIKSSSEVTNVQWLSPLEALDKNKKKELQLLPPQIYELYRLSHITDIEQLIRRAKERSCYCDVLSCSAIVRTKDGVIHLLPGDSLYPSNVESYITVDCKEKTVLELREDSPILNRFEITKSNTTLVIQNYKPKNHINMENKIITF